MKHLLLCLLLCLSFSCGKKSSKSNSKITQIFVQGDPFTMVKGTQKNKTSFMSVSNSNDFKDYVISGISIFAEKSDMPDTSRKNIEEGNEATSSDMTNEKKMVLNLKQLTNQEYSFEDGEGQVSFGLTLHNSKLEVTSIKFGKTTFSTQVEHYSISKDKSKFSFLLRLETKFDGKVMVSATFYKNTQATQIKKISKDFFYIFGPGVLVPWKLDESRKINVKVCSSVTDNLDFDLVKKALKIWEEPFSFEQNKLFIDVQLVSNCRPFSDVEEHSIQFVSDYLTIPDQRIYNPGFTLTNADLAGGNIFDADIILLGQEIAKDSNFKNEDTSSTISHEMGHFLGLDHQFDGKTSIMSYEDQFSLGTYDEEAIRNLYQ